MVSRSISSTTSGVEVPGSRTRAGLGLAAETWLWLAQRLSAAFLLFFLGVHFWVLHLALGEESISFNTVAARLQGPFFVFVDAFLLAIVLFHALNGLRAVLLDFTFFQRREPLVSTILALLGLATLAFGLFNLVPFIAGRGS